MSIPPPGPENRDIVTECEGLFDRPEAGESYLPVSRAELAALVHRLDKKEVNLIGLFCVAAFRGHPGLTLCYVLEKRGRPHLVVAQHAVTGEAVPSVARQFPTASWYEREIRDGFGLDFTGAFDTRRLFLHEAYPDDFHPLLKSVPDTPDAAAGTPAAEPYRFNRFQGTGVFEVPVGPVHAGIIEPGHFRFSVIGETVLGLEIRLFYKHRGIEKLAEGKTPAEAVRVAEAVSGDESAANATAFCMAVERLGGLAVPERAWQLRTVLLEMERMYSHLGDLGGMLTDVAYPVGAGVFSILREELLRLNRALTGSRFLKGALRPGGLARDIPAPALRETADYLAAFDGRFQAALRLVHRSPSVIDRLETTGVIGDKLLRPLNITGPAARASGSGADTRLDHPYGLYPSLGVRVPTAAAGDVLGRFQVKSEEVRVSAAIVLDLLRGLRDGPVYVENSPADGCALAVVEAPRGQGLHWVSVTGGVIDRYKVRTASFCNWQAIEHAVLGNIVPDFPLINKSLNLSYAGTDL